MLKNPTPRQIAFLVALYIAGVSVACSMLFYFGASYIEPVVLVAVLAVFLFLGAYFIVIFYLKKYIYRKIKLIYKTIHRQKLSATEKKTEVDTSRNIIEDVEKEVLEWADTQKKELDKYKSWAEYRRKFVGDISHELKTPIFNVQGYIHTLLDGGIHDDRINVPFLEKAAKNIHRLHTIVEDLGAISRLESGELMLEMQNFDIKDLTEEVFEDLEIKASDRKIRLSFKDGASNNYRVRADKETIRQVMMNLIDNSIKYGNEHGHTKVGFYDMDKNILIEIADNGIGIPKKHLRHVFDRFYRVDKSRSRAQGGSGLGLSIVKHIIEGHQQTINVRSTSELGSTFGFTLKKA